jgi:indole-3-glycerol phosphate synthase
MKNILEEITAYKRQEVEKRKNQTPEKLLTATRGFARSCLSLSASLADAAKTGIIAEFKRCSPSKGVINDRVTVEEVTSLYTRYGASGLSVLTDTHFFRGSAEDLERARAVNRIPILRKDFVVDAYQVYEAKSIGADVVLLIAECLSRQEVSALARLARGLGMEVLLEMHGESQLDKLCAEVSLVGVNNRDLTTFKVDIDRSIALAGKLPSALPKIAESGISEPETVLKMRQAGFTGFLMGEHFMKEKEPGEAFRRFAERIGVKESAESAGG